MNVWVTRDESANGPLSAALRAEHLMPVLEPVLRRRMIDDGARWLGELGADDWLVLTSAFAVQCLATGNARVPRVAVAGEATAAAARQCGMRVELVAESPGVESLFAELALRIAGAQVIVCYPRSSRAAALPPLPAPARVTSPIIYEVDRIEFDQRIIDRVDCAAVTSPSAVEAIGPLPLRIASIGPSTSMALARLGITPWVVAPQATFESLARAIADQARSSRHHRA